MLVYQRVLHHCVIGVRGKNANFWVFFSPSTAPPSFYNRWSFQPQPRWGIVRQANPKLMTGRSPINIDVQKYFSIKKIAAEKKNMVYLRTYEVSTTKPGDSNALKRRSWVQVARDRGFVQSFRHLWCLKYGYHSSVALSPPDWWSHFNLPPWSINIHYIDIPLSII